MVLISFLCEVVNSYVSTSSGNVPAQYSVEADEKRRNPDNFVSYVEADKYYAELKEDEVILDKLFEKTKYYIGIEQLARTLAEKFLNNLKSMEDKRDIDGLTSQVVNQVKQYSSGRSR